MNGNLSSNAESEPWCDVCDQWPHAFDCPGPSAENDAICGVPVNSDPGAPCTYPAGHAQWWHTHDGTLMPRPTPPVEKDNPDDA